jgi:hypothetical protein
MTFFKTLRSWFTKKPAVEAPIAVVREEPEPVLFVGAATLAPPHQERGRIVDFEPRIERNRGRSRGR